MGYLFALFFLFSSSALFAQSVPTIPYDSVANAIRLPANLYLGEGTGVAVNSKKHIFILSRGNVSGPAFGAAAAQLLEFAPDGRFLREIGKNLYAWAFGHTVRIDREDNIWVTDKGSDMIVKFNAEGRVLMVFGRKQEASEEAVPHKRTPTPPKHEDGRFRQPTDVTWDPAGNTYISDGYINSRIAKVDKNGNWVKSWGERGDKPGEFNTPHTIAADAQGNIYVGDRGNGRIQVFDGDGNFLREIRIKVPFDPNARPAIGNKPAEDVRGTSAPGSPWALCITPGPRQFLYSADSYPGRVYKMSLDGQVVGVFGESGKLLKQFGWIHEMACPSENELYVAEILNWRVQKLILHPDQRTAATH
ncbi:MAG TPA: peptidyl-alpha-hydroxyglycine alpha-amidating lyase family protein [Candidatus Binatia bacterium]